LEINQISLFVSTSLNHDEFSAWTVLQFPGRSIIFTTHYLEEADVLADRKAVLARGRVEADFFWGDGIGEDET